MSSNLFKKVNSSDYINFKKRTTIAGEYTRVSASNLNPMKMNGKQYNRNFNFMPVKNGTNCLLQSQSQELKQDYTSGVNYINKICGPPELPVYFTPSLYIFTAVFYDSTTIILTVSNINNYSISWNTAAAGIIVSSNNTQCVIRINWNYLNSQGAPSEGQESWPVTVTWPDNGGITITAQLIINYTSIPINLLYSCGNYNLNPMLLYNKDGNSYYDLLLNYNQNGFITKSDISGNVHWATYWGDNGAYYATAITVNAHSLYVAGYYSESVLNCYNSLDLSTVVFTLPAPSGGGANGALVKYNASGNPQWATYWGGDSYINTINTDGSNIYVAGYYNNEPLTVYNAADQSTIIFTLPSPLLESNSSFVKYDTFGIASWATYWGRANSYINSITSDTNNLYVAGYYSNDTLAFYNSIDPNTIVFTLPRPVGSVNNALAQYDISGNVQWATYLGGDGTYYTTTVKVNSGNIYVVGTYYDGSLNVYSSDDQSTVIFTLPNNPTSYFYNSFLVKYDVNGIAQWATYQECSDESTITSITADTTNIYVAGIYGNAFPSGGALNIYNAGDQNTVIFTLPAVPNFSQVYSSLVKYDTNGIAQWATYLGYDSPGYVSIINTITTDTDNIYVAGFYFGLLNVYNAGDQTTVIFTLPESLIGSNSFTIKYNKEGIAQWATYNTGGSTTNSIDVDIIA